MPTTLDDTLLRDLYGTAAMREVFDSEQLVQRWLDAEAALALALADAGVIPADAASDDRRRLPRRALRPRRRCARASPTSQHPLVPLIRALVASSRATAGALGALGRDDAGHHRHRARAAAARRARACSPAISPGR